MIICVFFKLKNVLQNNQPFRWIKKQYNNVEVMIIENGWSDKGELNDNGRVKYLRDHLEQVLTVVLNNECNLKGYSGWFSEDFLLISGLNVVNVVFCFQFGR